jgi:hypothetical protein
MKMINHNHAGKPLKNGGIEIWRVPGTVLAIWHNDEYVTWSIDHTGNCYHGRYFTAIEDAIADFFNRADFQ